MLSSDFARSESYEISSQVEILPWVGVLRVDPGNGQVALTGIVLIHDKFAISNSYEVVTIEKKTIRKTTQAQFHTKENMAWYCNVTDYILHPDYGTKSVNTIALVFLEVMDKLFKWYPIQWAKKKKQIYTSVFNIGYTDRHALLEQTSNRMVYVEQSECVKFYQEEGIDFQIIWPPQYRCYKNEYSENTCVFDAGMALATNYTGKWELLGLSIQGPGCSLPSRYIDVQPYIPWIESTIDEHLRILKTSYTNIGDLRSNSASNNKDSMFSVDYEDADTLFLAKINDTTMVLRPFTELVKSEKIMNCDLKNSTLAYRDLNKFDVPSPAVGIYVVSYLDTLFEKFTCITLTVFNAKTSKPKFWLDKGFHQDDIGLFLKKIPLKNAQGQYLPRIVYVEDTWKKYEVYQTANLMFRFELAGQSWFDVQFYGELVTTTPKSYYTLPTPSVTRKRPLPYPTKLRPARRVRVPLSREKHHSIYLDKHTNVTNSN